jgi:hypothetical protein
VLREDPNAGFVRERRLLLRRVRFAAGRRAAARTLGRAAYAALLAEQQQTPTPVLADGRRVWWLFRGRVFWEDEGYAAEDVRALALERERRKRRRLGRARDAMRAHEGPAAPRPAIPEDVRRAVFRRDGGRCRRCGSAELLQFDHVIPIALGGSSAEGNLQLLCTHCNREKGDAI